MDIIDAFSYSEKIYNESQSEDFGKLKKGQLEDVNVSKLNKMKKNIFHFQEYEKCRNFLIAC